MKNINKILAGTFCALSVVSCQDLDTEYLGDYVTTCLLYTSDAADD